MSQSIGEQLYEQFQEIQARITGPKAAPYDFREGEPWNATLERLPRTCDLWRRFLEFDTARRLEAAQTAKRQGWQREIGRLRRRWYDVDPDAVDLAAYRADRDRWELLEHVLAQPERTQQYHELKGKPERAESAWQQTWQEYNALLVEERRITRSSNLDHNMAGMFDGRRGLVRTVEQRRRRFEAAQGAPA